MKVRMLLLVGLCLLAAAAWGQNSNGSDGALNITSATPGVVNNVLIFDPRSFSPALDPDGDNVYHFTTVTIASGITVKLKASKMRLQGPVVWLATGDVTFNGWLDLRGEDGYFGSVNLSLQKPAEPGPGGFPGGMGARAGGQPQPGRGPGGGAASTIQWGCSGGYAGSVTHQAGICAGGGAGYGSNLLQPLIGGSGGGGGMGSGGYPGSGGGAGGGAIRIRSATRINGAGSILADGGSTAYVGSSYSGAGSGGAIHLQAPQVTAHISAAGGAAYNNAEPSQPGRVRVDSDQPSVDSNPAALTGPFTGVNISLPTIASVRVVSIRGVAVPEVPNALYTLPDVQINDTTPVPIVIVAYNIPIGTVVRLYISSADTGLDMTADTTPLAVAAGGLTGTATVALPSGVSRIYVRATW